MQNSLKSNREKIEKLALSAILTALVAVLAYMGGFIKIGGLASVSLTLIPVVIGSALCGPMVGAFLGLVAAIFFVTPDAAFWLGLSPAGTIITVLVKGILSGLFAGLAYKLLEKKSRILAVFVSAVVCPVTNTGIFLIGCLTFFMDAVKEMAGAEGMAVGAYLMVFFVGLNFVFELIANLVFSPAIVSIINLRKKKAQTK